MKFKILLITLLIFTCISVSAQNISVDIGYPAVDEMETKVLGAAYPQENIYTRLDRLEYTIFGAATKAPLSDRVDRLRSTVLAETPQAAEPQKGYTASTMPSYFYSQTQQSSQEQSIILYELEKKLLGTVYINEPTEVRVSRLERIVFQASSDNYPVEERLQRLCAYADAKDSDQYYNDQAKLNQYANVANGVRVISLLFMILQAFL